MLLLEPSVAMCDSTFSERYSHDVKQDAGILVSTINSYERESIQWESMIDDRLIDWAQHRDEFALDGLIAPSDHAISKAYKLLKFMRDHNWPLPTSVIADGEGGVVVENRRDPVYQRIEISDRGDMQLVTFRDRRMQGPPAPIDID